jgi:uncharacterized membrane protein YdjX (TVP38/TMEM64 family)
MTAGRRAALLLLLIGAMLALAAAAGFPTPDEARRALGTGSGWAPVIAVLGVAALALLLFPRTGVAVLGGVLYGPAEATAYVLAGTLLGGSVAFGIGRLLGRDYLSRLTAGRLETSRTARLDAWLHRRAFLAVVVARLVPVLPFGLLNYGFGASRVPYRAFVAGTAVAILPTTFLYATVGSAASDPTSPVFLGSAALAALLALAGVVIVGRVRRPRGTHEES